MAENYNIDDFINVESPIKEEQVKFKRFKSPFKVRSLTADEVTTLRKQATKPVLNKRTHTYQPEMDQNKFSDLVMAESVIVPDLKNEKLQKAYGAIGEPAKVLELMLSAGEYVTLSQKVMDISGLNGDSAEDLKEEAKN